MRKGAREHFQRGAPGTFPKPVSAAECTHQKPPGSLFFLGCEPKEDPVMVLLEQGEGLTAHGLARVTAGKWPPALHLNEARPMPCWDSPAPRGGTSVLEAVGPWVSSCGHPLWLLALPPCWTPGPLLRDKCPSQS